MRHAEALLLVHDQKPQRLETHVVGKQPVRADQYIHLAGRQPAKRLFLLPGADKAAEQGDLHGIIGEAAAEVLIMLLGQQRGGG